jgi:hypothetical protein
MLDDDRNRNLKPGTYKCDLLGASIISIEY